MKNTTEYWVCVDCYITIGIGYNDNLTEDRQNEVNQAIKNLSENGYLFNTDDMTTYDSNNCECCFNHNSGERFKILLIEEN